MASTTRKAPPPGERFKLTLISLANIMSREMDSARAKNINTINKGVVDFGIELIKNTNGDIITGGFISRSFSANNNTLNNYWDKILEKDKDFFMSKENSSVLFGELSSGIVDGFMNLVRERHISDKMMDSIWQHLFAMVKMSIAFVYLERNPQLQKTEDGFSIRYTNKCREHINLEEEASKWGVDLTQIK